MPDHPPLVRQWMLLRALCARRYGMTVKEMSQELGVTEKTIRRDLDTFQSAGFPLTEEVVEHGLKRWKIDGSKSGPGLNFSYDEAIALFLGRRLLDPLAGTPFYDAAQRAFRKIRAALGTAALEYVERFSSLFHQTMVGISDYSQKSDLIDQLLIGIEDRKTVFITYQSLRATEPVTYDVYPYGLVYHRRALYLVGRCPDDEPLRHWKVDRIADAEVTQFPFTRPADFNLQTHLADSFGIFHGTDNIHVKVRFAPRVSRYVLESKWHDSQQLTPQKDGSVVAEFDLADTEEIKRWVMSFGAYAAILEPPALRAEVVAELKQLLADYQADSPASPPQRTPRVRS